MKKPGKSGSMDVDEVLAWLERRGTKKGIADLARYGVTATRPFGVSMGALQSLAKSIASNHELAAALWATGRYDARLLATLVDDPERVTKKQMNAWAADFDNWGICDTACFKLFDKTPHAWDRAKHWVEPLPMPVESPSRLTSFVGSRTASTRSGRRSACAEGTPTFRSFEGVV